MFRRLLISCIVAVGITSTGSLSYAQEEAEESYKFSFDIGPGFFTTLDDTVDQAAVETYLAVGLHPSKRFALGVRVNATTEEGIDGAIITGSPWGFGRAYLTGLEGGLRTYVEVAVSMTGVIAVRGGGEVGVAAGMAAFATVDGRKLSEEEAKDLVGLSGGMRMRF